MFTRILVLLFITVTATAHPLLVESLRQLNSKKSSSYQHKTQVDETNGVFKYDCSGFLTYSLKQMAIPALSEFKIGGVKVERPLARDFYNFFQSKNLSKHWSSVKKVSELVPGDIVVWIHKEAQSTNTGHVVVVAEKPYVNSKNKNEFLVKVIDSARSGHSQDTRKSGESGLGSGTMALAVNDKGSPIGYRWNSTESEHLFLESISMGRVLENP